MSITNRCAPDVARVQELAGADHFVTIVVTEPHLQGDEHAHLNPYGRYIADTRTFMRACAELDSHGIAYDVLLSA